MKQLVYGLITGIMFGFLLQKARVIRYDKQLGALRFIDMTIVKFMLSSVFVGMIGVYVLTDMGLAKLSVKSTILGGVIPGGLIFGLGWGLLGYCPGTSATVTQVTKEKKPGVEGPGFSSDILRLTIRW